MTAHIVADLEIAGGHRPPLQGESLSFGIQASGLAVEARNRKELRPREAA